MAAYGTSGIVCAVRHHGEHGAIVRLLTPGDGLVAGYVRGGRSRRLRPVLLPGNMVQAEWRARAGDQLPALTVDLVTSRAPWHGEPLASAAIAWVCALTAECLPEDHAYPPLFAVLSALLDAICHAQSARGWVPGLIAYEVLLLRELGYGGTVQHAAAPPLVQLHASGVAIARHLLGDGPRDVMAARARLIDQLRRAIA